MKHAMRKMSAGLLALAVSAGGLPLSAISVHAENVQPELIQFASVGNLMQFNTNNADGTELAAKIYFGDNNQQWWIVGSQSTGKVDLFAASPMKNEVLFDTTKGDSTFDGVTVYKNHYGASEIRNAVQELESTNFSSAEQAMMDKVKVYTKDTKNNKPYATDDKLYLANGNYVSPGKKDPAVIEKNTYITIGENDESNLSDGLRVDKKYLFTGEFWLRTPQSSKTFGNYALSYIPQGYYTGSARFNTIYTEVGTDPYINKPLAIKPAARISLDNVSFAANVSAATQDGTLKLEDTDGDGAFTLRMDAAKSGKNLGSAQVSFDKQKINYKDVPAGTYLVVQESFKAKAKKVNGTGEVLVQDMGFNSFENCNVWLETTDSAERMTYATLASVEPGVAVNVTAGSGLTVKDGNQVIAKGGTVKEITVSVNDGYYLADDYVSTLQAKAGGLVVTGTVNCYVLSGTAAADINITLPDATSKEDQAAPVVTGGIGSVIHDTTAEMEYASSLDSDSWTTCVDGSTETGSGTWYVRYKETKTKKASPATEAVVIAPTYTIWADLNALTFDTQNEGYGTDGLTKTVTILNTGNSSVTLEKPMSISYDVHLSAESLAPKESAILSITPVADLPEGKYDEIIEVKTKENTSVGINVSFAVNGELNVSLSADRQTILEGESATLTADVKGGSGNYTYTWYAGDVKETGLQGSEVNVTPVSTTTYTVVITDTIENKIAMATITVMPKKYDLEVPGDYTFETKHVGYTDVSGNRFVIRNSGNVDVTNIQVSLSDTEAFILDTADMQNALAVNESTSFVIEPKDGLPAGNYTATVQMTGDTGVVKTFTVSFVVEDHTYESIVTEPTCTTKGYTTHRCTICGASYTDSEKEMLPYVFEDGWNSDESGHWKVCKNCGTKTETEAHTFTWVEDTKQAKHEECTVCGYKKTSVMIPGDAGKHDVATGVRTNLPLWVGAAVVSGVGLTMLFILERRNRKNR